MWAALFFQIEVFSSSCDISTFYLWVYCLFMSLFVFFISLWRCFGLLFDIYLILIESKLVTWQQNCAVQILHNLIKSSICYQPINVICNNVSFLHGSSLFVLFHHCVPPSSKSTNKLFLYLGFGSFLFHFRSPSVECTVEFLVIV